MSKEKSKSPEPKEGSAPPKASPKPLAAAAKSPAAPPPPLFRRIDWAAFAVTMLLTFIGYYLTLAPDLTLQDSGELAVGSFYAGVPHPPGYPVWTLYTWLFTVLVPVSNIAWRVALSSAFAGAVACGLVALLASRGSSMIIEGIQELKGLERRWENAICLLCGYVAGMLMGFNGYMWSQAVIVEVYTISVLSLMGVLACLLRWLHAPEQRRYLYWAMFWFGICFTNHQTLIVAAMGIELAVAARDQKLGRDLFFFNSIIFILGLIVMSTGGLESVAKNQGLFRIFCLVGVGSIVTSGWLIVKTESLFSEWKTAVIMGLLWLLGALFYFYMPVASMSNPPMNWGYARTLEGFKHALTRGQYEKTNPTDSVSRLFGQIEMLANGAKEEFNLVYLAIGLIPIVWLFWRMVKQHNLGWLGWIFLGWAALRAIFGLKNGDLPVVIGEGIVYGSAFLLLGLTATIKMVTRKDTDRPEESWLAGLSAIYLCLAVLLIVLLNPGTDRQNTQLTKVFFTASHVMVALCIGYGLALVAAVLITHYERVRLWALGGGTMAAGMALYSLLDLESQFPLAQFTATLGLVMAGAAVLLFAIARTRAPVVALLAFIVVMPSYAILSHWSDNEERDHLFGFWFGHDMFTPPFTGKDGKLTYDPKERAELLKNPATAKLVYPEMDRDAVLFGGTDPGRFCPTYMIFCESFIKPQDRRDPNFDRRDVYIITQNALADATYLMYIRAHYNRSTQLDPAFFQDLVRSEPQRKADRTTVPSKLISPLDRVFTKVGANIERERRAGTSLFSESDFTDVKALSARLCSGKQQDAVSKYLFDSCSRDTQALLTGAGNEAALRRALARDFNVIIERELTERAKLDAELATLEHTIKSLEDRTRLKQERLAQFEKADFKLHSPARFEGVKISEHVQKFIAENPQSHTRIRLNRLLLEAAYPKEIARSIGGVYPDREIKTPTPEDSQKAFNDYMDDVRRRRALGQTRQGENFDSTIDPATGQERVSVSGQVAVMGINGMLTKTIFDKNPTHEFYVEESFPLDWMYPYLTPFGIIMKINRQPLTELTEEIVARDHHFWSKFSERLIGDRISYDTTVSNICDFAERVYHRRDFTNFTGDPKFVRDDDAQKAFSKLRSAQASLYYWRINSAIGRPAEQARMIREAEFAYKQAFAYCPYSPEAVFRYTNLLLSLNRPEDAILVAKTFLQLDPRNPAAQDLVRQLTGFQAQKNNALASQGQLAQLIAQHTASPGNLHAAMPLLQAYANLGQTNQATVVLDTILLNAASNDFNAFLNLAGLYGQLGNQPKRQVAMQRAAQYGESILTNSTITNTAVLLSGSETFKQIGDATKAITLAVRAVKLSDVELANPQADLGALTRAAQAYNAVLQLGRVEFLGPLEGVMTRLANAAPNNPEAWYDLAAVQTAIGKTNEGIASLGRALSINRERRKSAPTAQDLEQMALQDKRFANLRSMPAFQKLFAK